jgi:hypothetical protein
MLSLAETSRAGAFGGASTLFKDRGFRKGLLKSGPQLFRCVEASQNLCHFFGAKLERPRVGDLLLRLDACTFQYEVRDVHTSVFDIKTNDLAS